MTLVEQFPNLGNNILFTEGNVSKRIAKAWIVTKKILINLTKLADLSVRLVRLINILSIEFLINRITSMLWLCHR